MPTYDYHCSSCQHTFEESQSIKAEPLKICPACGQPTLRRGPGGGIGLQFKGSGFYITDYKKKEGSKEEEGSKKEGSKEEAPKPKPESSPSSSKDTPSK